MYRIILFIFLFVVSCSHKLPKTYDYLIYPEVVQKLDRSHNNNLELADKDFRQDHIYVSGVKWEDRNLEGITYQIPVICDNYDLEDFFQGRKLRSTKQEFQQTNNKPSGKNRKTIEEKNAESISSIEVGTEARMLQFSYLLFIDECRIAFYSNPSVRYDKDYNPVIKNELKEIHLDQGNSKLKFEKGYYYWKKSNQLILELRSSLKENSTILEFTKNNEGDLELKKVTTYKFGDRKDMKGNYQQIIDKEIDILNHLPDISSSPKAYQMFQHLDLKINNKVISRIDYELSQNVAQGISTQSKFARKYIFGDSTQIELLDIEKCISW